MLVAGDGHGGALHQPRQGLPVDLHVHAVEHGLVLPLQPCFDTSSGQFVGAVGLGVQLQQVARYLVVFLVPLAEALAECFALSWAMGAAEPELVLTESIGELG